MRSRVLRIVIEDGAARGVEIEVHRGQTVTVERVAAGVVVASSDLLLTLEHLVGEEHLEPGYLASLRALRPTFPCFLLHLGLRGVPDEVLHRAQGYYWDSWEMDRVGIDALKFKIFSPTLYEPAMAPPGGQIVIVQKVQEIDYEGIADWAAHKRGVEDFIFAEIERLIPGFSSHVVTRSGASALTSWRFTLNQRGAMLGWEMSPDQLGASRPGIAGMDAGGIRDLFFVGHWTRPGGGITPVIVSAQQAAREVTTGLTTRLRNEPELHRILQPDALRFH
jgi:phytoene dehydrogenase-like protein